MSLKATSKLTGAAIFLALLLFALSIWPQINLAQGLPQGTPAQINPDNPTNMYNSQSVSPAEAAVNDNSGLAPLPAPKPEIIGGNERMIVVDPAKERKEREKMYHDPTFDGTGLFADIKGIPSATPGARVNPIPSASPKATAQSSEKPKVSPSPSATPGRHSPVTPVASPVPHAPKSQGVSPVPSATPSPHN
jgi:hypothetical protein